MIQRVIQFVPRPIWLVCAAFLPYLPFLSLPIISDTYTQIFLARQYGAPSGWADLAADPLYRCRATSLVLTWIVDSLFGASGLAHKVANLLVHAANVYLVYALGRWRLIGYRVSFPAALFFALYEGHQEAVVWVAALPELLMFLFALATLHAWVRWSDAGFAGWRWPLAASGAFLLALASKESAVALVPVLAWVAWREAAARPRGWGLLSGFALTSCGYAALIFAASRDHLHLNDGTFSLQAPVWLTLPHSMSRMLWVWGMAGLLVMSLWGAYRRLARPLEFSALWMMVTLLPYSFLLYMDRVPSRHTYFAAAGLALIIGMAFATARARWQAPWVAPALVALIAAHNCGYLWAKKLPQYERRAEPTERFIDFARSRGGAADILVRCRGPYPLDVYRHAAAVALRRPPEAVREVFGAEPDESFCESARP